MISEDYVSFEVAKLLKDKGFNEPIWTRYEDDNEVIFSDKYNWNNSPMGHTSAPTLQMAMKWLREEYNIIIEPESVWNGKKWEYLLFIVTPQNADSPYYERNPYKSYEECVDAAIKYSLENLI